MSATAQASIQSARDNVACMRNYCARILEQLEFASQADKMPEGFVDLLGDVVSLQNILYRMQGQFDALVAGKELSA